VLALHHEVHDRIEYLPGAEAFLETVRATDIKLLLVTNSHPDTLKLKEDTLGFSAYFDSIHSSHNYGHAKEDQEFWRLLQEDEGFDPETTMFVDDTVPVLRSAAQYGIRMPVVVTLPDTTGPVRENGEFAGVEAVRELL
jgi:putative hydrolase of the HAD superfamily